MLKILLTDPLGNGSKYALAESDHASFLLGRAEDCDIVLPHDDSLSRYHAHILYEGGRWIIRDNQSVNGLRLGQKKLPVLFTTLQLGTVLTIGGGTILEVIAAGEQAPAEPAGHSATPPPAAAPKRFASRSMKRAGGKTHAAPRRLNTVQEAEPPTGRPAEHLGLPHDFALQFFLAEPRHVITAGSVLRFGFLADEDCRVYLVQHDSAGGVGLILPTQEGEEALLHARRATALPPRSFLIADELVASPPFGTDTVIALACTQSCHFARHLRDVLQEHPDAAPGAAELQALQRCAAETPDNRWSSAVLSLETRDK